MSGELDHPANAGMRTLHRACLQIRQIVAAFSRAFGYAPRVLRAFSHRTAWLHAAEAARECSRAVSRVVIHVSVDIRSEP